MISRRHIYAVAFIAAICLVAQGQLAIPVHVTMGGDGSKVWKNQNWQDGKIPVELHDGDTLEDCNIQCSEPHTPFAAGVKGLVLRRCMALNCDLPPDVKLEGPNVANVHQRFVSVVTKSAAEVKVQQEVEAAAIKTAEAAVASAPVTAKTVSAATAEIEAKKQAAVAVEVDKVADKSLAGLIGRGNPDGSVTYGRLEIVK